MVSSINKSKLCEQNSTVHRHEYANSFLDALSESKKFLIEMRTAENWEKIVNAEKLGIETEISRPLRRQKTPKGFDYEHEDQTLNDPKTSFQVNVFFIY